MAVVGTAIFLTGQSNIDFVSRCFCILFCCFCLLFCCFCILFCCFCILFCCFCILFCCFRILFCCFCILFCCFCILFCLLFCCFCILFCCFCILFCCLMSSGELADHIMCVLIGRRFSSLYVVAAHYTYQHILLLLLTVPMYGQL